MNKVSFMGNGETKDFHFNFPFFTKDDVVVTVNEKNATGYNVICTPKGMNADIPFVGGIVRFLKAPKATDNITICRKLELNRNVDYQPTEHLNPTAVNHDMNYFIEILKDMKAELAGFAQKYADITNKENTDVIISKISIISDKIDHAMETIEKLGSIENIHSDLENLANSLTELTDSINTNSENITALTNAVNFTDDGKAALKNICAPNVNFMMPSNTYVDFELTGAGQTYVAPAAGYVYVQKMSGTGTTYSFLTIYNRSAGNISSTVTTNTGGVVLNNWIMAKAGDRVEFQYNLTGTTNCCRFIYAEKV